MRVLHCPLMVGGNPQGLANAERRLGLESWAVSLYQVPFNYKTDEVLYAQGRRLSKESRRWALLLRAIKDFDVIHFNFGETILSWTARETNDVSVQPTVLGRIVNSGLRFYKSALELRDLPLLRRVGKGVVVTFQGDDARQGDFCRTNFQISPATEVEPGYYTPASDAHKRERIKKIGRHAHRIFSLNPDLLHVLPRNAQFLPYAHLDLDDWKPSKELRSDSEKPVVIHAPSHRGVKGTRFVVDAVSRLKSEGIDLDFTLVEGVPHSKVREIYERADLLVDQLLCGWYGGLAVELMALGKPVICYIREGDLKFIPSQMRDELPIINATPKNIYDVLKEWLTVRKHQLPEVGQRSRTYVEKWHDPLKIAAGLKAEYEVIRST